MKNAKNVYRAHKPQHIKKYVLGKKLCAPVNFWQIDHKIKNILEAEGVTILSSPRAWEKFGWVRKIFKEKPKEGYFVWVQKQPDSPLATCVTLASPKTSQNLTNLLVIEKNIKAKANVVCHAAKNNLCGKHLAKGKLILKENSSLEYNHLHSWGEKDLIFPDYEFILEKNSRLIYTYKNLFPPKNLKLTTTIHCGNSSSAQINFIVSGSKKSQTEIKDTIFLEGQNSQAIAKLRLVGKEKSQIIAFSKIIATSPSKGHLDCQGLLVDKGSKISLVPGLVCNNKEAQLTHEASIGKISEEALTYLRTRGLNEKEAINLIVSGFLTI